MLVSELIADLAREYSKHGDRKVIITIDDASWPPELLHAPSIMCVTGKAVDFGFTGRKEEIIEIIAF